MNITMNTNLKRDNGVWSEVKLILLSMVKIIIQGKGKSFLSMWKISCYSTEEICSSIEFSVISIGESYIVSEIAGKVVSVPYISSFAIMK